MSDLESRSGSNLLQTFLNLGSLVQRQQASEQGFDSKSTYGEGGDSDSEAEALQLFDLAFAEMRLGKLQELGDWKPEIRLKQKGIIDPVALFENLRKLPDHHIRMVRLFIRFVGQQLFSTTVDELYELQESRGGLFRNPFYDRFTEQVGEYGALFKTTLKTDPWPEERLMGPEREAFMRKLHDWRSTFLSQPGMKVAMEFFDEHDEDTFNAFFHLQQQFDSPSYRDFDKENNPYPQPLPKIAAYRAAMGELQTEFTDLEGSVGMCFDYCRMEGGKVVDFVLSAEDTFLRITTRLDRDYPLAQDYSHRLLHERAQEVKMMMFPLRCLFFDELDARRGVKQSNDNTLDSYMDMTLGETTITIPPVYRHTFAPSELLPELQEAFMKLNGDKALPSSWAAEGIVKLTQKMSEKALLAHGEVFKDLSGGYEQTYKSDENNLNRRLARLAYLYLMAMSKKSAMAKASEERLGNIESMANKYAEHAERYAEVDLSEDMDLRNLRDDQLPLMVSPEQMEELFRTSRIVARLGENSEAFEERAKMIEKGLQAALDMMTKAGELMDKMVNKMFPNKEDSKDLLDAIHELIDLGYKTQQALADLAKKEGGSSKDKKLQAEIEKLKTTVQECKDETARLQGHLTDILGKKRELIDVMRITKDEKAYNQGQLRKITVMTIQSIQSQNTG